MMALFHKRRPGGHDEQVQTAEDANTFAQEALREAKRRRPTVESMVETIKARSLVNGFGDDFTISITPRGKP